ncbi:hypothetical protein D3C76_260330 [compost metagenome]
MYHTGGVLRHTLQLRIAALQLLAEIIQKNSSLLRVPAVLLQKTDGRGSQSGYAFRERPPFHCFALLPEPDGQDALEGIFGD